MKFWLILSIFILCGCQTEVYTVEDYLEDTKALFMLEDEINMDAKLEDSLTLETVVMMLKELTHEDLDYLVAIGCLENKELDLEKKVSQSEAMAMNQCVYEELYQREFYETYFEMEDISFVDEDVDLTELEEGIYAKEDSFYQVTEQGEVKEYDLEMLELETTFVPDLSEGIILPENSEVSVSDTSFQTNTGIDQLASHYFKFKLKDYTVSGRVQTDGLQIKVSKKLDNGGTLSNELSLDDLKCTVDLSLKDKEFYFRTDYTLKDTLRFSKSKTVSNTKLELKSFEEIKQKIASLVPSHVVEDELHLLTFQFEVPSTANLVKITMDLSLKLLVNGEVELTFSSKQQQGTQTFQSSLNQLNQQQWEVKPYIEGSLECASVLNFGLNLGTVHLADVALQGGIGAEAKSYVHYVDKDKQLIETTSETIDLTTMELLLDQYDLLGSRYVDICGDINVYYFARIAANQKTSLLRKLGLYGSLTPIKQQLSLIHIENHQVVDACTKSEILFNPENEIDAFDISNYQLYLTVGKTVDLTTTKDDCVFSSSNPDIIEVDQTGKVTALKVGYATIIVKDKQGIERHCLVFVQEETSVSSCLNTL